MVVWRDSPARRTRWDLSTEETTSASSSSSSSSSSSNTPTLPAPRAVPGNETTTATTALASLLSMADVRYEVVYYGEFLKDLPRRMGTNEVLDASVVALTHGYSAIHTHEPSAKALGSYVTALKTLRFALQDPEKVRKAETLCGIYLIMVCQVRLPFNVKWTEDGWELTIDMGRAGSASKTITMSVMEKRWRIC